jgi:hypothetical protein
MLTSSGAACRSAGAQMKVRIVPLAETYREGRQMQMNEHQAWKNFNLGQELEISGTFIYNGLRRFHEMQVLDRTDEVFEFFYNLSVGIERLLKIAVVLVEHQDGSDQEALEKSLITHSHLELMRRLRQRCSFNLGSPHNEFLGLLGTFYKSLRYDRFTLSSVYDLDRERKALCSFLGKHLKVDIEQSSSFFATQNNTRYRKYIKGIVTKISNALFEIVRSKASELNIYTYDLPHGSRAETVFVGGADLPAEELLWKELLVFFMNTKSSCKHPVRAAARYSSSRYRRMMLGSALWMRTSSVRFSIPKSVKARVCSSPMP